MAQQITEIHLNIPQSWNQLSQKQAKNISYFIHCMHRSASNNPELTQTYQALTYIKCAKELLRNNTYKALRTALKELTLKAYQPFVGFLFKDVELQEFPESFKSKNILYGPSTRLRNVSIEEFSFADALYFRYKTLNDVKYLDLLCSTLYRPKSTKPLDTDLRTPYSRQNAERQYTYFKDLPLKEKIVVCYAFEGSRNHIVSQFPNVFPKRESDKDTKPKYVPFGKLISAKINYDVAKLKEANSTNIYAFFALYENELIELKKVKPKKQ
jgi:hypothetical protein